MISDEMDRRPFYFTGEAARLLGVRAHRTIRAMCERGEIPGAYRAGKWWRIPRESIERILADRSRGVP